MQARALLHGIRCAVLPAYRIRAFIEGKQVLKLKQRNTEHLAAGGEVFSYLGVGGAWPIRRHLWAHMCPFYSMANAKE